MHGRVKSISFKDFFCFKVGGFVPLRKVVSLDPLLSDGLRVTCLVQLAGPKGREGFALPKYSVRNSS